MKIPSQLIAASLLGMVWLPAASFADVPIKHVPAKAPPPASLDKPVAVRTVIKPPVGTTTTNSPKPPVVTAVAPKFPVSPAGQHGIIFVGGKPGGGKSALNPQPIPPGHGGPGDPIH
jgi:hypothetical protein